MSDRTPTTSETLLNDLATRLDAAREEEFARLYEPVLRRYVAQSRACGTALQPADRDDLVQEVFIAVRSALPGFHYDRSRGRFRNYLRRAVRNAVLHFRGREPLAPPAAQKEIPQPLPDDTGRLLIQIWTLALERVFRHSAFAPNTKAIFRRAVLEDAPVADVAREFAVKPGTIRQVRKRVLDAVRAELDGFGRGRVSLEELLDALLAADNMGK